MRKAVLILGLLGASFAGGALVNGPAQAWARQWIRTTGASYLEPTPVAAADPLGDDPFPAAPLPTLTTQPVQLARSESRDSEPVLLPPSEAPPTAPPAPAEVPAPPVPSSPLPKLETAPSQLPRERASTPLPSSSPASVPTVAPERPSDPPRRDPALARAVETAPIAASPPSSPSASWADLRHRLAEAGVRRYWIEAEPAGPVRFRCVIPLAGEHAVGQQFEADGDDENQAIEATLKRIALWKAVEGR